MRRTLARPPSRRLAVFLCAAAALWTTTASAAPQAPPPTPASSTSTTTEVTAPSGTPVVVVNNTVNVPAPAPAAAAVVPVLPAQVQPYPPRPLPTAADRERSRLVAEQQRARSLRIGGWALAGGTYGLSALAGTISIDSAYTDRQRLHGGWLTVPVAGPFVAAFYSRSATGGLLTTSLGVAQALGLGLAILGGHRYRRAKRNLMIAATPTPGGGGQVGVSMRF